jgi:hypothetical protein
MRFLALFLVLIPLSANADTIEYSQSIGGSTLWFNPFEPAGPNSAPIGGSQPGGAFLDTDTYRFTFDFVTNQFGPPLPGRADFQYDPFRVFGYIEIGQVAWDYLFVDGLMLDSLTPYVGFESTTSSFVSPLNHTGLSHVSGLPDFGLSVSFDTGGGSWEGYPVDFTVGMTFTRVVPEPASVGLLALALPGAIRLARRRRSI